MYFTKLIHANVVGITMLAPGFIGVLRYFLDSFCQHMGNFHLYILYN